MAAVPDKLSFLHQAEEGIRAESLVAIGAEDGLSDHLLAVHDALDHLTELLQISSEPGDDQHTLQLFVIRLFNISASALKLGLSGYYQQAFQLLRDSLEMVNLVDLFSVERSKISEWRLADDKTLRRVFSAVAVRAALERHVEFVGQKVGRDRVYALFSAHAAHMTYKGFNLVAPGNTPRMGPFFHLPMLRALLEDMGKHVAHSTLALSMALSEGVDAARLDAIASYIAKLRAYHSKYLKPKTAEPG